MKKIPTCGTCVYGRFTLSEKTGKPVRGSFGLCSFTPPVATLPISITTAWNYREEFSKRKIQPNETNCPCHKAKDGE